MKPATGIDIRPLLSHSRPYGQHLPVAHVLSHLGPLRRNRLFGQDSPVLPPLPRPLRRSAKARRADSSAFFTGSRCRRSARVLAARLAASLSFRSCTALVARLAASVSRMLVHHLLNPSSNE